MINAIVREEAITLALSEDQAAKLAEFAGAVQLDVQGSDVTIRRHRQRITMQQMLDACDPNAPISEEDVAWDRMKSVGRELL